MIKTAILTVSDTRKKDNDMSGKVIRDILNKNGFSICKYEIVPDEIRKIKGKLIYYADVLKTDLVLTTGGTGFAPRDVTPEATKAVIEKETPGIVEMTRIKSKAKYAYLSRAVAGIRKKTLIVNLPGNPAGVEECVSIILPVLKHAVEMIKGHTKHKVKENRDKLKIMKLNK
jgi:molybdenum cofactor synthesis domain-containing protein